MLRFVLLFVFALASRLLIQNYVPSDWQPTSYTIVGFIFGYVLGVVDTRNYIMESMNKPSSKNDLTN